MILQPPIFTNARRWQHHLEERFMPQDHKRLSIEKKVPGYWKVTLSNPPINLFDPEMFAELRVLMDQIENDKDIKVVSFDSADPEYFISHYDIVRGEVVPDMPGAAPFSEWPAFVTRLAQSRVISIAKVRGRARGHGSELALACDMRFVSREKAIFAQIEVGCAVVPGGWRNRMAHGPGRSITGTGNHCGSGRFRCCHR